MRADHPPEQRNPHQYDVTAVGGRPPLPSTRTAPLCRALRRIGLFSAPPSRGYHVPGVAAGPEDVSSSPRKAKLFPRPEMLRRERVVSASRDCVSCRVGKRRYP